MVIAQRHCRHGGAAPATDVAGGFVHQVVGPAQGALLDQWWNLCGTAVWLVGGALKLEIIQIYANLWTNPMKFGKFGKTSLIFLNVVQMVFNLNKFGIIRFLASWRVE